MCGGFNQGEVLRVVNSEKVEIHVGNDVSGRRCFRCRIYGPIAANQYQRQEYGGKKKTDSQTSVFHKDSLSATTNNRHLSEAPQVECPRFVGGDRRAVRTLLNTSKLIDCPLL